ncbi:hypothetical protein NBRC110019_21030 [Neptunitalea chrysea]|uniref:Uncharacterized protein n=2 Tax=Neptunitalea chrysea TaxID=1647581 RepID=A0A9W6EWJ4_9FLAO|nr:hypothetical protein NBRC110019_21030 [Neptunitalea chrysea]
MVVADQQLLLTGQQLQLNLLQDKIQNQQIQLSLLEENNTITTTQLTIAKQNTPKNSWLGKLAIVIGVFSTGYIVGNL